MPWHVTIDARMFDAGGVEHPCVNGDMPRMFDAGGVGTFLQIMIAELAACHKFHLTLLYQKKDREDLLRYNNAALVPMSSSYFSLKEQLELPLKIPACDLFWSPSINIPILPIRAKKRLTTIHDVFHLVNPQPMLKKGLAKMLYARACALSDRITTPSQFSQLQILSYCSLPQEKLVTIPLGVQEHFAPAPSEAVRKKYQLPEKYLLTVSNGRWHKNLYRLEKACEQLSCPLVVVGKEVRRVEACDLPALYSMATAFVFPSLYEGFGLPPLEAMACDCPVITSRVASLPEVCGDAAAYVDPYSISSIREGIERVMDSQRLRQKLVERGRERSQKLRATDCAVGHRKLIESMVTNSL